MDIHSRLVLHLFSFGVVTAELTVLNVPSSQVLKERGVDDPIAVDTAPTPVAAM